MFSEIIYKNLSEVFICLLFSAGLQAQTFEVKQSLDFLGIENPETYIADLNNDGLLDVFVRGKDISGQIQYLILARTIVADSSQSQVFNVFPTDVAMGSDGVYTFSDVNNDNWLDLIISGKNELGEVKSEIYPGTSGFNFQSPIALPAFEAEKIAVADLNNDGQKEIVWQGVDEAGAFSLEILTRNIGNDYEVVNVTLPALAQGDLVLFDFDKNNSVDIFYQGLNASGIPTSIYLKNLGDFNFETTSSGVDGLSEGNIKIADYDADGLADILVHGLNDQNTPVTQIYVNKISSFEIEPVNLGGIGMGQSQFADLNHDGLVDIALNGIAEDGQLMNITYLQVSPGNFEIAVNLLPDGVELDQSFGDIYFDGNLDVLHHRIVDGKWIFEFLQNTGLPENQGPQYPLEKYVIQTFDDVKLFWSGALDDKTPAASLSHDIYIGTESQTSNNVSPSFDLDSLKRILVRHGNQSFNEEMNIFGLQPDIYYYGIQSVDNSFHARTVDTSAMGEPFEDSFVVCASLNTETVTACDGGELPLSPNGNMNVWYSANQGFLGLGPDIDYTVNGLDTLFYGIPGSLNCDDKGAIIINIIPPIPIVQLADMNICAGQTVSINYPGVADSLQWTLTSTGETSTANPWNFTAQGTGDVHLEVYQCGLTFYDTIALIAIPSADVNVNPNFVEIFSGDTVQLNAFGANSYQWTPSNGLNQDDISNPMAMPTETTIYTVTGSIGTDCDDSEEVTVVVYDFQNLPDLEPCPGEEVSLFFPGVHDTLVWTVENSGEISSDNPFNFSTTDTTKVYLEVEIGSRTWFDTIIIAPIPFEVTVAADTINILAGDTVELMALGAATYSWSPMEGLNQNDIANPMAFPTETTLYQVIGTNAMMCQDSATVLVVVLDFKQLEDVENCAGEEVSLFFPWSFENIQWNIAGANLTSSENPLSFIPDSDEVVFLEVMIGDVLWMDTINIIESIVNITVQEDTLIIPTGASVELSAMGAEIYIWSPATDLDDPTSPNPIAQPTETTLYQVLGLNDIGCTNESTVQVIVKDNNDLFIPTLFTPNNDNRNETFKIYGGALPVTLDFEVFNRSGQSVFETTNINQLVSTGWDGAYKGKQLPAGIYYWKASGTNADGSAFSYEGKNTGYIHLLR